MMAAWLYDRSTRIHHYGDEAAVWKDGTAYSFYAVEQPANYRGSRPTLAQAKQSAVSRLHPPEPSKHVCYDCRKPVPCTIAWSNHFHGWYQTWPGALRPIEMFGGFAFVHVCAVCLDKRKDVPHG